MAQERIRALARRRGYDLDAYSDDLLSVLDLEVGVATAAAALHPLLSVADRDGLQAMAMEDVLAELAEPGESFGVSGRGFPSLSVAVGDAIRDMADAAAEAMDPFSPESEAVLAVAASPAASPSDVADAVMASVAADMAGPDVPEVEPGSAALGRLGFVKTLGKVAAVATLGPAGLLVPGLVEKVKEAAPAIADKIAEFGPAAVLGPLALAPPEFIKDAVHRFATGRPSPEVEEMVGRASGNLAGARPEISSRIVAPAVGAVRQIFAPPRPSPFPALPVLAGAVAVLALVMASR